MSWFYNSPNYAVPAREDLQGAGQLGINQAWHSMDLGVSTMGKHIRHAYYRHNCSPVVSVLVQAKSKLQELMRMKKPNLP
jgi:hypothetical protein